ncbi:hypothetical protein [uncultured Jatrophihabitans sp.]|uniref:hypothetical protein n=1 Tax=uncultured Jatrophihabitans sp. TaxID=1610747 RepID=UPI0035CB0D96
MTDPEFRDPGQQPYAGPPPTAPYVGDPYAQNPYVGPHAQNPYAQNPYAGPYPGGAYPGYPPPPGNPYAYPSANPYGYANPGPGRPGTLTAAAVLGYVTGGLLILAAIFVFAGASVVNDAELSTGTTSLGGEFVVAGIANLLAAGLFIGGSVAMSNRSLTGRALYAVAAGITVVASLYWGFRFAGRYDGLAALMFYALLFAALAVVGASLAFTPTGGRWLAGR